MTTPLPPARPPRTRDGTAGSCAPPNGPVWDLLVIGGGTAGITAARTAAGLGATVLLVERDRTGGDCLWTGCVPSKALLAAGHAAAGARDAARYGIRATVEVDFPAVMAHVRAAIAAIAPDDSPATLEAAGVRVRTGTARLTGPSTADVDGDRVAFRQAVLATGSAPVVPEIPGLVDARPLTSATVWALESLPRRLLVLGGGGIGCELGQAFARLGSTVTLVESADRVLAREDPDAAALVAAALRSDGVDLRCSVTLVRVRQDGDGHRAEFAGGGSVPFDAVLAATGRRPRTDGIGAIEAGVALGPNGHVQVDGLLRTTNPRIWAAGDLTAHPPFTHTAGVHGTAAAVNAVLGLRRHVDDATQPRVTYTQPEVAAFGPVRPPARGRIVTVGHGEVDRAVAEQHTAGFARLVLDRRGRIAGATLVGPRAGEGLAELVLAADTGTTARSLAGTTHAYPAWTDGVWKASIAELRRSLNRRPARLVSRVLVALRRRWMRRG